MPDVNVELYEEPEELVEKCKDAKSQSFLSPIIKPKRILTNIDGFHAKLQLSQQLRKFDMSNNSGINKGLLSFVRSGNNLDSSASQWKDSRNQSIIKMVQIPKSFNIAEL